MKKFERVSSYRADKLLWQNAMENNYKGINARVMVPVLCLTSSVDLYVLEVYRSYPEQISIDRADRKRTTKKCKCKCYGACSLHVV